MFALFRYGHGDANGGIILSVDPRMIGNGKGEADAILGFKMLATTRRLNVWVSELVVTKPNCRAAPFRTAAAALSHQCMTKSALFGTSVVLNSASKYPDEPGSMKVAEGIAASRMNAVNFVEVASYFIRAGMPPLEVDTMLGPLPVAIIDADIDLARMAGHLRAVTADGGLSVGDRFCLALALRDGLPAWTADRQWRTVSDAVGTEIAGTLLAFMRYHQTGASGWRRCFRPCRKTMQGWPVLRSAERASNCSLDPMICQVLALLVESRRLGLPDPAGDSLLQ